jgi:hypothetical protein
MLCQWRRLSASRPPFWGAARTATALLLPAAEGYGGSPENAFPCRSPEPVIDDSTGFLQCESGLIVRAFQAECSSQLPRPDDVPDYQFGIDDCQNDAGCTRFPHGFCRRTEPGEKATCGYGCVTDDDCQSPLICVCGDPIGLCGPASCVSDDSCLEGFHCASNETCGGFVCQHEDDACATDGDCAEGACVVQQQRRTCTTDVECLP